MKFRLLVVAILQCALGCLNAAELPELSAERTTCVVAVEYLTETET